MVIAGACSETLRNEKLVELGEGGQRDPRRTEFHSGAGRRIEHPDGHLDDYTRLHLEQGKRTIYTVLEALKAETATEMGMPRIMDDAILPDMGRMNGR